jgi:serine/threonine-protein kinase
MSPEQARGQAVDKRTDMWAFGCVLYEMLTGRVAFKATTLSDTLVCVLERDPDWTALPATAPPGAHGLMRRCLEKDSRRRLRDIGDVRLELESLQHACEGRASATPSPHASIAVLSFAILSADKDNEYFGDGLAEEIINALTQVAGLRVIARTSAFAFKDRQEDVRRIAEMLGVANILQGSVRRAGQRIRVTTQLITGADATQVWSNRYDREITDVFAVQDEIAQAVVDALRDRLGMPVTKRIVQRQTADIEAYCLYVQGRHHFSNFEPDEMDQGRRLFEEALAVDPTYALPFVDLAHYYWVNTMTTRVSPIEGTTKAMQAVERALTLDDTLGEAVGFLGRFRALYEYRWADGVNELERAMEMNPASTLTPQGQAVVFTALNRLSEAVRQQEHALKADPFSPLNQYFMTRLLVYSGDYERAAKHAQQAMELAPQSWIANAALGLVDLYAGRISGALRALETAKRTAPAGFVTSGWRGCAYVRAGETGKAERLLEELQKMASPVPAAMIHAELGNTDAAFEQLQAATRRRDFQLYSLQVDPAFDSLRSESRYEDLLGSMKLHG